MKPNTWAEMVGGGFAGVTAACKLTMRGRSVVLVEACARLFG
jgi:glycine/D-amino acid oxidase-like deaminating enzyme